MKWISSKCYSAILMGSLIWYFTTQKRILCGKIFKQNIVSGPDEKTQCCFNGSNYLHQKYIDQRSKNIIYTEHQLANSHAAQQHERLLAAAKLSGLPDAIKKEILCFDLIKKRFPTKYLLLTFSKALSPSKFFQNKPPDSEGHK